MALLNTLSALILFAVSTDKLLLTTDTALLTVLIAVLKSTPPILAAGIVTWPALLPIVTAPSSIVLPANHILFHLWSVEPKS